MAIPMVIGDHVEVRVVCVLGDQTAYNIRHFRVSGAVGPAVDEQDFADALDTIMAPKYKAVLSAQATYRGVGVRVIWPLPRIEEYSTTGSGSGLVEGDPLPKQTCGMITIRTATPGKRGRGRVYVPFPGEVDSGDDAKPIGSYVTRIAAIQSAWCNPVTVAGSGGDWTISPVLYRRADHSYLPIITGVARAKWATHRSRGDYGRPNPPPF